MPEKNPNVVSIPLNRYVVEMVNPEKCIRGIVYRWGPSDHKAAATSCDQCLFRNGNDCVYEKVTVDYAKGEYIDDYVNQISYEQFCCPNCGELVSREKDCTLTIQDWDDITCKHCKAEFVMLDDDFEKCIFALARKPYPGGRP